jgi:hypothetical protein
VVRRGENLEVSGMTGSQATAPPSAQKVQARQVGLRQASLAILIVLIVQFALGMGVNLYVTLRPGHASWFGSGALLALRAALGMVLILGGLAVLIRAIMARNLTLIVTLAAGFAAILLAAFFGAGFTSKLTNGYSLGMAIATAVALACYAVGLFAATAGRSAP